MKANLKKLREEFQKLTNLASMDLSNWDPRTKPGMEGKQNAAKSKLEDLKEELANAILANSTTILVSRDFPDTGTVVESAQKNPKKNIVIDFLSLEKNMFREIFDKKINSLTFNSEVVSKLNILMVAIGKKINALELPLILSNSVNYGTLKTKQEMVLRIEKVMDDTYGTELRPLYLRSVLMDEMASRLENDTVNVLLVNVTPKFTRLLSSMTGQATLLNNDGTQEAIGEKAKPSTRRRNSRKTAQEEAPAAAVATEATDETETSTLNQ